MFFLLLVCFTSFNLFMFYISFELIFMLMFIFLLVWGYSLERVQASFYMVFYTIVVSFPFLIFVMFMETGFKSMKFVLLCQYTSYWWTFMFFVFLVKLPVYTVHLWLPKAHVEAPVAGSMLLAGVLLKLGGYGLIRLANVSLFNLSCNYGYLISVGTVGSLISCFLCLKQSDLKAYVAYSSVCHMGLALAGIFSLSSFGLVGGVSMLIAHGFCSSCLFYMLYVVYERFHSRSMLLIKGALFLFPLFSLFWFLFCVLNMGVPPSFPFFSEVSILTGILSMSYFLVLLLGLILLFAGVYCIFLFTVASHSIPVLNNLGCSISMREYLNMYAHLFPLLSFSVFLGFFV